MKIKTPEYIELATNSTFSIKQENEYSTLEINSDADLEVDQFYCYSIQSSDYIICGGSFTCNGSLKSGSAEVTSLKVKQAGNGVTLSNALGSLISDGNIIPTTTGACDLGGSAFRWGNVYSLKVDTPEVDTQQIVLKETAHNYTVTLTSDSSSTQLNVSGNMSVAQDLFANSVYATGVVQAGKMALQADPSSFKIMYKPSDTVYEIISSTAYALTCSTATHITLSTTIATFTLGTDTQGGGQITFSLKKFGESSKKDFLKFGGDNIYPAETNKINLGTSPYRFKQFYCDNINCNSLSGPTFSVSSGTATFPIGSLILACISLAGQASGQSAKGAGTTIVVSNTSAYIINPITLNLSGSTVSITVGSSYSLSEECTFKLLTSLPAMDRPGTTEALALMIRVS